MALTLVLVAWLLLVHPHALSVSTTFDPPALPSGALAASPPILLSRPPAAFTAGRRTPAPGSGRVLHWRRVATAAFYDVVLSRDGKRVLDLWPTAARVALPSHWTYHGRRFSLTGEPTAWFVYPAAGTRSAPRYGSLAARGAVAAQP